MSARVAFAAPYTVDINVQNEQDLLILFENGEIDEDEFGELLELMQTGVDLNTATRDDIYALPNLTYTEVDAILQYREANGRISTPEALVPAGAITDLQLRQIRPFLVGGGGIVDETSENFTDKFSGWTRLRGLYTAGDGVAPPFLFTSRLKGFDNFTGFISATGTRRHLSDLAWDSARQSIAAAPPGYRVQIPKFFLEWKKKNVQVLAGTYRLGFGERLTLANTQRVSTDGIYGDQLFSISSDLTRACNLTSADGVTDPCGDDSTRFITNDFRWTDGFRGVAGNVVLPVGEDTSLSVAGFASYQNFDIYQYDVFSRNQCDDPRDPNCTSPSVYARYDDLSLARPTQRFVTLREAYDETMVGGHVGLNLSNKVELGLTGYRSSVRFYPEQAQLDFQESATIPFGGPYGAVGADVQANLDPLNFGLEVTRSFDSMPGGGGGFGVVQRSSFGPRKQELQLILRYYDDKFANPYGRPVSQADLFEGNRARNEAGARLRYRVSTVRDWRFLASADFWLNPHSAVAEAAGTQNLELKARVDYTGIRIVKLSTWGAWRDRNLGGPAYTCYADREGTRDSSCTGLRMEANGMVRFEISKKQYFEPFVRYQHIWAEDSFYQELDRLRQDRGIWVGAISRPLDVLWLRGQFRYRNEDISSSTRLEDFTWSQLEARLILPKNTGVTLRYDRFEFVDDRASTQTRQPGVENRFQLQLEAGF